MTKFGKAPSAPEFKPKAPKPNIDSLTPKIAKLKEANKPKALIAANKAKATSNKKTLAKLPKVTRMGKGEEFVVKGKAPKVTRMGKGEEFVVKGTADNFTDPKLEKLAKQFKFQEKVIKPLSTILKDVQDGKVDIAKIKGKLKKSIGSLTQFMLVSDAPKFMKTISVGKIDMKIQQQGGKTTMTIVKDKQKNKFVENNKLVMKPTALAKLSTTPPARIARRGGGAGENVMDI